MFAAVDEDGNGTIDPMEFAAFVDGCVQVCPPAEPLQEGDVTATFRYIDTDDSNDIDFDELFSSLAEIGFDGTLSSCVAAWTDRAEHSARHMLEQINSYLKKHPPKRRED